MQPKNLVNISNFFMQNWLFDPIDIYCERIGSGFWDEPLNAISNISFIIAAWFAWYLAQGKADNVALEVRVLAVLIAMIGLGSFLFHTLAVRWSMYADITPISLYQGVFLYFYLRNICKLSHVVITILLLLFVWMHLNVGLLPVPPLNGSIMYVPTLLFLWGIGVYHLYSKKHLAWGMLGASALLTISLVFRSIDFNVCEHISIGTHALWHLLNGLVLYITVRTYALNRPTFAGLAVQN